MARSSARALCTHPMGAVSGTSLGLGRRRGKEQETEQTGDSEIPDFILHALRSVMEGLSFWTA